ncbi:hypothetical protein B5M09_011997 [Aphanomyces astaci]|uniref:Uncharacterized protein n=1 Tax=Aphanomyces astaci TaxID=112090 RepID=A0A425D7X9_APHAT|nr:hypothetical protein B5M09_011997 [Aphanomyces astaci]
MRGLVSRGFAAVGRGGRCHRSTGFKRAFSTSFSWQDSPLVDRSMCKDAALVWNDLQVMQDVLTLDEERLLADEAAALLRRRRYEVNHWDQVIVNFKEMETVKWSQEAADILARVRTLPILPQDLEYFPPVHVIDLAEAGYIKPHVDSIKCPGTPRPSDDDVQDIIDKRGLVFGLGGSTNRQPPPSPNSPARPVPAADRTYRSLFQQPAIEVQPAYAENDWYDFLFLPAKLLAHTKALKANPTLTPTAHDVLTELLRKAKPAGVDEPTKARDHTLQCLAALVVLQLEFTLEDIEAVVPTNLQKALVDGLVKYATDPRKGGLNLHDVAQIAIDDAMLLRNRWQLRVAIKKMHTSALTVANKLPLSDNAKPPPDEVEQLASISGLVPLDQLLDDIQASLALESTAAASLRRALQMDLGVFYFHRRQFDEAVACFEPLTAGSVDKVHLAHVMT